MTVAEVWSGCGRYNYLLKKKKKKCLIEKQWLLFLAGAMRGGMIVCVSAMAVVRDFRENDDSPV